VDVSLCDVIPGGMVRGRKNPPSLRNWQATACAPPSAQHRRQAAVHRCEPGGNHCPSDRVRRHRSIDRGRRKAGVRSEGVGGISCVRSRIADACVEYAWQHGNRCATAHVSQWQGAVAQFAREAIWSCPNNDWVYRERSHNSKRGDGGTSGSGAWCSCSVARVWGSGFFGRGSGDYRVHPTEYI